MASLEHLELLLTQAARLLDEAAGEIRDLHLSSEQNVRKVAEALVKISEIRSEIYQHRPDLTPDYFRRDPS